MTRTAKQRLCGLGALVCAPWVGAAGTRLLADTWASGPCILMALTMLIVSFVLLVTD